MFSTDDRPQSRQPIPEDATVVYKGALFEVLQWRQTLFDGSVAQFEKIRRPDTAYVIPVTADGNIEVIEQTQSGSASYFGLIGGRVEAGEKAEQAARRELLEETGLEAEQLHLLDAFQFLPKIEWAIFIYFSRGILKKEGAAPDPGERIRQVTLTFDEFIGLLSEERFGDVEVALRILRRCSTQQGRDDLKRLLGAK